MTAGDVRRCIKCGREVGADESVCEICNRAGMATPSASQYHGTVAAAIILSVAALAIVASLSFRGVGPYAAELRAIERGDTVGFAITYSVTNEGTRPGRAKCQLIAIGDRGQRLRVVSTITAPIPGGDRLEQTETVPGLQDEPAEITVSCS